MSWLPTIYIQGTCICERGWEAEGRVLHIRWGSLILEITLARIETRYVEEPANAR